MTLLNLNDHSSTTLTLDPTWTIDKLQFTEDGDKLFFHYTTNNVDPKSIISTINIHDNGSLGSPQTILTAPHHLQGLCVTGAKFGSNHSLAINPIPNIIENYQQLDTRPYMLGIANLQIDTVANAQAAVTSLHAAADMIATAMTKITVMQGSLSRQETMMQGQIGLSIEQFEQLRDIDAAEEASLNMQYSMELEFISAMISKKSSNDQRIANLLLGGI